MPHNHPERGNGHESDSLFKGIVMGAVIGVGVAWLLGTEEGKKLKKSIEGEGSSLLKRARGEEEEMDEDSFEELPKVRTSESIRARAGRAVASKATKTSSQRFFHKRS